MRPGDEVEAAYFSLLRAREDLERLQRFQEFLADEVRRLRRFTSETQAHEHEVDPRMRRRLSHTRQPLADAVLQRIETCQDELDHMPDRILDAEAYVTSCEAEHNRLRTG